MTLSLVGAASRRLKSRLVVAAAFATLVIPSTLFAQEFVGLPQFYPGNLVVSRSVYDNLASNVTVGEQLPPNCTSGNCVSAVANGTYPFVFNNAPVDGSFGITSRIFLDQLTPPAFHSTLLNCPITSNRGSIARAISWSPASAPSPSSACTFLPTAPT